MDILFLEVLELLSELRFAPSAKKLVILEQSLSQIDRLKFFAEITWENKLIKVNQFSELIKNLSEIGRELGGWKKGLNKTPPK